MELEILIFPDERLNQTSKTVTEFGKSLKELAKEMLTLMKKEGGIGIAAPQVGVLKKLFIVGSKVFVNPIIKSDGDPDIVWSEEKCLSVPGVKTKILRLNSISITAQDVYGKYIKEYYSGLKAFVAQHELDHLLGKLIKPIVKLKDDFGTD